MEWYNERECLVQKKHQMKKNSQLKKKMSIVKKLRNLTNENYKLIIDFLSEETMDHFYSEIVCAILNTKILVLDDLKNVIRVISLYIFDNQFMDILINFLNFNMWWHHVLNIEIQIMRNVSFDYVFYLIKVYKSSSIEERILYLGYIKLFHTNTTLIKLYHIELSKVYKVLDKLDGCTNSVINIKGIDNKVLDKLDTNMIGILIRDTTIKFNNTQYTIQYKDLFIQVCKLLQIPLITEEKSSFKKVITETENEFDFYLIKPVKDDIIEIPKSVKEIYKLIKKEWRDLIKIDAIGRSLRRLCFNKYMTCIFNRLKKDTCLIPTLARLMKIYGISCRKLINLSNFNFSNIPSNNETRNILLLISELAKFKFINSSEIFNLLDNFYKTKDIELFCFILKNVGRFYLLNKETNSQIRSYIEKLILYGNNCGVLDKVFINDTVANIFPKIKEHKSLEDFFVYYFQDGIFNKESYIANLLQNNKLFLLKLLLTPWKYKSLFFIGFLSKYFKMDDILIDLIPYVINLINSKYKMKTVSYTKLLSVILKDKDEVVQVNTINRLISILNNNNRLRVLIYLIYEMNHSIRLKYIDYLYEETSKSKNIEIQDLLFNLAEDMGIQFDCEEDDSYEEELKMMKYV